jgi:hypothetical protein
MRHVKQRRTIDCGVAALATATGVSYEAALDELEIVPAGNGDLLFALDSITKRRWRIDCLVNQLPLNMCILPEGSPIVLVIQEANCIDEGTQHTHFICLAREHGKLIVFDPRHSKGPIEIENYRRGQTWLVSEMLWSPSSISPEATQSNFVPYDRYREAKAASVQEYYLFETGQLFGQIVSINFIYVVVENLKKNAIGTIFLVPCSSVHPTRDQVKVFATSSNGFAAMKRALALAREDNANGLREMRVRERKAAAEKANNLRT